MSGNKIVLEYADFEMLLAKLESIERKVSTLHEPQSKPDDNKLLPRLEAASYLGIGRTSFDKLVKQGELSYTLVGKTKKYLLADLEEYKNRNRMGKGVGALLPDAQRRKRRVYA